MKLSEMMRTHPVLRGALIAPSVVVLIFCLFNLTAVVDQNAVLARLSLGVVNLDEGVPLPGTGPLRVGDQAMAALERLPLGTTKFPDEASATAALTRGEIVAVLIFPPDFSAMVVNGGVANARVINTDHLSIVEAQVGRSLPGQLQAALSMVAMGARAQLAAARGGAAPQAAPVAPAAPLPPGAVPAVPVPPVTIAPLDAPAPPAPPPAPPPQVPAAAAAPPVVVTSISLYSASPILLQAPFVMSFASWMGALIGSVLLFIGTRWELRAGNLGAVLSARTLIPLLASVLAGLVAVLTVASLTGSWTNFWELWAYRWLVTAAAMATITALFALFSFAAFLLAVPLVFYQALVSGALAPPTAAPDWIAWLGRAPLHEATVGLRTLLIGGPPGSVPWTAVSIALAVAIVAGWVGTLLWSRRRRANR